MSERLLTDKEMIKACLAMGTEIGVEDTDRAIAQAQDKKTMEALKAGGNYQEAFDDDRDGQIVWGWMVWIPDDTQK